MVTAEMIAFAALIVNVVYVTYSITKKEINRPSFKHGGLFKLM